MASGEWRAVGRGAAGQIGEIVAPPGLRRVADHGQNISAHRRMTSAMVPSSPVRTRPSPSASMSCQSTAGLTVPGGRSAQPASSTPRKSAARALIAVSAPKMARSRAVWDRMCSAAAIPEIATTMSFTMSVVR